MLQKTNHQSCRKLPYDERLTSLASYAQNTGQESRKQALALRLATLHLEQGSFKKCKETMDRFEIYPLDCWHMSMDAAEKFKQNQDYPSLFMMEEHGLIPTAHLVKFLLEAEGYAEFKENFSYFFSRIGESGVHGAVYQTLIDMLFSDNEKAITLISVLGIASEETIRDARGFKESADERMKEAGREWAGNLLKKLFC